MALRICVVSDTHRDRYELMSAVVSAGALDAVLHAGDETSDAAWLSERIRCPVYAVAGNWDTPSPAYPDVLVLSQFGPTVLLTHGHRLQVKSGLTPLAQTALARGAQIAIYGHTHIAEISQVSGTLCINPGSLSQPRGRLERTYALLITEDADENYMVTVSHRTTVGELVFGTPLVVTLPGRAGD